MCGRRLAVKHFLAWWRFAVGCGHVSGLLVQPFSRLLALMWFARQVLINGLGSIPVTHRRFSRLDDRPIDIMPSAPPQPVTPNGVFLWLWCCNRAPSLRRSPIAEPTYPVATHASARYWAGRWPAS